jgi:phosphatidylglycerophosphate synthase
MHRAQSKRLVNYVMINETVLPPAPRSWDARLARRLILPLVSTSVTPNHLTSLRLVLGLLCAAAFARGGYAAGNLGALLLLVSNLADHADGELARVSGKTSRFGHLYDLAADALTTVLLFVGIGIGIARTSPGIRPLVFGAAAGCSVALIFYLRMKIEDRAGKASTQQPAWSGFEAEDVLYLMPLVTLADGLNAFLSVAAIGAPLAALAVIIQYLRVMRVNQPKRKTTRFAPGTAAKTPVAKP